MSVDIIKIDDEYFCDTPLMFYLFVQQKKLKTAAPVSIKHI